MDIVRLGPYNNVDPTYLADRIVEGFTSKVWTERYLAPGEFELKTPYIDETMRVLPEMTLISHRHTKEVMKVETHEITTDEFGQETLTVRGRSADCILESRFVEGAYGKKRKMNKQYTPLGAALVMMWNVLDNEAATPYDVTRQRKDGGPDNDDEGEGDRWPWNAKDKLPNVAVSDSVIVSTGNVRRWWLTEGMMYEQLLRMLDKGDLGIRTIRPPSSTIVLPVGIADGYEGERVWVKDGLNDIGDIGRDTDHTYVELRFDVYKGADRSLDQSDRPAVVFSVRRDHFKQASSLYSAKDWKTALEIRSGLNRKYDIYRSGQSGYTGWDRLVIDYDAGEPDIPSQPDKPGKNANQAAKDKYDEKYDKWIIRRNKIVDEFEEDYKKDGVKLLKQHRKVSVFSGDLSDVAVAQYAYKRDYFLGDTVTLAGRREDDLANVIVSEYVLTEDDTGERGYPGFELADAG